MNFTRVARRHFLEPLLARPPVEWRLVNRTRGLTLALRVEPAFSSVSRRRGLLGRQTLDPDAALAIAPSNAIHTFGMRFPIDVLFVRRDGRVLKRVVALKARRIAISVRAFAVLEFAAGNPGIAWTQAGDRLEFEAGA
jgi:uncharacterized membrane protein (UPF0127 family)